MAVQKGKYVLEVEQGRDGKYFVHMVCQTNGQIMMTSESYATRANANRAGRRLRELTGLVLSAAR